MGGFEKMSQYSPDWQLIEQGAVRTVLEAVHPWTHCTVRQRLIVYNLSIRIDFEVDLLGFDGFRSREFRVAFPLRMENAQVAYQVPMGVVEVGENRDETNPGILKALNKSTILRVPRFIHAKCRTGLVPPKEMLRLPLLRMWPYSTTSTQPAIRFHTPYCNHC